MEQLIEQLRNSSDTGFVILLFSFCIMLLLQIILFYMLYYYIMRLKDIKLQFKDLRGYIYMHTIKGGFSDTESSQESNASQESYGQYTLNSATL